MLGHRGREEGGSDDRYKGGIGLLRAAKLVQRASEGAGRALQGAYGTSKSNTASLEGL